MNRRRNRAKQRRNSRSVQATQLAGAFSTIRMGQKHAVRNATPTWLQRNIGCDAYSTLQVIWSVYCLVQTDLRCHHGSVVRTRRATRRNHPASSHACRIPYRTQWSFSGPRGSSDYCYEHERPAPSYIGRDGVRPRPAGSIFRIGMVHHVVRSALRRPSHLSQTASSHGWSEQ